MQRSCFDHFVILLLSCIPCMIYTSIAPLLPLQLERRALQSYFSGVIFFCYSIGFLSAPLAIKPLLKKYGRLHSALFLGFTHAACLLFFGVSKTIPNDALFLSLSMLSRLVEGFVLSLYLTIINIMIPSYFQNYSSFLVAYSLGVQLADLTGPLFGGLLFRYLGYFGIFLLQSLLFFFSNFLLLCFTSYERNNPYQEPVEQATLSYSSLLKVPVRRDHSCQAVFFGCIVQILAESFYISIDPILPFKLARQFNLEEHGIGLFFFRFTAVAVVSTLFLFIVPHRTNKLYFILPGYFLLTAGAFMTGPSKLLGLPNNPDLMTVGMCVAGVGKAPMYSFAKVFIFQNAERRFPESTQEVYHKVNIIATFVFGVALMVIPFSMSLIYKAKGFQTALDILGIVIGINAVAFLLFLALYYQNEPQPSLPQGQDEIEEEEREETSFLIKKSHQNMNQ